MLHGNVPKSQFEISDISTHQPKMKYISIFKRLVAETQGFEPWVPFWGYAHLANECLQPLGHVSVMAELAYSFLKGNAVYKKGTQVYAAAIKSFPREPFQARKPASPASNLQPVTGPSRTGTRKNQENRRLLTDA